MRANPSLAHRATGHSLLSGGKASQAIAAFTQALNLSAPDPVILNNRGLAYSMAGQHNAAIADYSAALKLSPNDPVIRFNRATAYARVEQLVRACLDLETVIRLNPGYIPAYRSRALLYARMGDPARSQADSALADQLERAFKRESGPRVPAIARLYPRTPKSSAVRRRSSIGRTGCEMPGEPMDSRRDETGPAG